MMHHLFAYLELSVFFLCVAHHASSSKVAHNPRFYVLVIEHVIEHVFAVGFDYPMTHGVSHVIFWDFWETPGDDAWVSPPGWAFW